MTASIASLDVSPDGTVVVLEPHGLHRIARDSREVTDDRLESYGYHEVAVSSHYLVMTQEYYRYEMSEGWLDRAAVAIAYVYNIITLVVIPS